MKCETRVARWLAQNFGLFGLNAKLADNTKLLQVAMKAFESEEGASEEPRISDKMLSDLKTLILMCASSENIDIQQRAGESYLCQFPCRRARPEAGAASRLQLLVHLTARLSDGLQCTRFHHWWLFGIRFPRLVPRGPRWREEKLLLERQRRDQEGGRALGEQGQAAAAAHEGSLRWCA